MIIKAESVYEFEHQPRFLLAAFRLLAVNRKFLRDYASLLEPSHWREVELRWLAQECKEYWKSYGKAPKLPTLKMRLDGSDVKPDEKELILRVIRKLEEFELDDETRLYVEDNFEAFIKYRATLYAIHEAQELVDEGDLDGAVEVVRKSQLVQRYSDDWVSLPDEASKFFEWFNDSAIKQVTIPAGLGKLDEKLGGGVRKGELGVVVAPLGFGKSQFLVHVGANAFRLKKTVVHFSFENSKEETLARYMYNLTSTDSDKLLHTPEDDPRYQERLEDMRAMGGCLKIIRLIGSATTATDLDGYLQRLEERGVFPDVVLVDYGDLMAAARRSSHQSKKYEELQTVYEELRDLAAKHKVVLWTASQANREGLKGARVLTYHIADSLGKGMVADIIISMSKDQSDKQGHDADAEDDEEGPDNGKRILHLLKLRRGGSDNWFINAEAKFAQAKLIVSDHEEPQSDTLTIEHKHRLPKVTKSRRKADPDDAD